MENQTAEKSVDLDALAKRHGVSRAAVEAARDALAHSGGSAAQFSHPDLGGSVQWMRGGMLQIGDMFNRDLKERVGALLKELSGSPAVTSPGEDASAKADTLDKSDKKETTEKRDSWWPTDLGTPSTVGGQNDHRYAFFPDKHRLVMEQKGKTTVYDTGDKQITGAAQGQGTGEKDRLAFSTSGGGAVTVGELTEVEA